MNSNTVGKIKYFYPTVKCTDCVFGVRLRPVCFRGVEYAIECSNTECASFGNKMDVNYCEIPCGNFVKK